MPNLPALLSIIHFVNLTLQLTSLTTPTLPSDINNFANRNSNTLEYYVELWDRKYERSANNNYVKVYNSQSAKQRIAEAKQILEKYLNIPYAFRIPNASAAIDNTNVVTPIRRTTRGTTGTF